jgi:putative serine protease PepD
VETRATSLTVSPVGEPTVTTTQDTATNKLREPGQTGSDPGTPHSPHDDGVGRRVGGGRPAATRTAVIAAAVAALVGSSVGVGAYAALENHSGDATSAAPAVVARAGAAGGVAAAAATIAPSIVTINVASGQTGGTGSGVIIRSNGWILTNNHVVTLDSSITATPRDITVTLENGRQAKVDAVRTDATDDLAVVHVTGVGVLPAATMAPSGSLVVGQPVAAVGAPLGLSNTVTSGIVSALGRPVQTGSSGQSVFDAIQTDAAINPGNSGGALVNIAGQVVGINSANASTQAAGSSGQPGSIGIGFAIPSDEAGRISQELITTGHAEHAAIGVTVRPALSTGDGPTSAAGATIASVVPGGPAAQAGMRPGDVITKVGHQLIDDPVSLAAAVRSYTPGRTVSVTVSRGGVDRVVSVKLTAATS